VAGLVAVAFVGAIVAASFTASLTARLENRGAGSPEREAAAMATPMVTTAPPGLGDAVRFHLDLVAAGVDAFHAAVITTVILLAAGGIISLIGIRRAPGTS
jgi:hypothetical protein